MAQLTRILKSEQASVLWLGAIALGLLASGCEAINSERGSGRLPAAPQTVALSGPASMDGTQSAANETNLKSASLGPDGTWRVAEARGLVVTDSSPSEYTRKYLNQDYAKTPMDDRTIMNTKGDELFTGETYSVVTQSEGSTPQYVTADGQPYPDYEVASPAASEQRFVTAEAQYSTYETGYETVEQSEYGSAYEEARAGDATYGVHLASYRVEANVYEGWQVLSQRYGAVLSGLVPRLSAVDIPEQGAFLRLKAGPFSSRGAAAQACRQIKAGGDYCAVMRFDGTSF